MQYEFCILIITIKSYLFDTANAVEITAATSHCINFVAQQHKTYTRILLIEFVLSVIKPVLSDVIYIVYTINSLGAVFTH